jgi:hypothetical protein
MGKIHDHPLDFGAQEPIFRQTLFHPFTSFFPESTNSPVVLFSSFFHITTLVEWVSQEFSGLI